MTLKLWLLGNMKHRVECYGASLLLLEAWWHQWPNLASSQGSCLSNPRRWICKSRRTYQVTSVSERMSTQPGRGAKVHRAQLLRRRVLRAIYLILDNYLFIELGLIVHGGWFWLCYSSVVPPWANGSPTVDLIPLLLRFGGLEQTTSLCFPFLRSPSVDLSCPEVMCQLSWRHSVTLFHLCTEETYPISFYYPKFVWSPKRNGIFNFTVHLWGTSDSAKASTTMAYRVWQGFPKLYVCAYSTTRISLLSLSPPFLVGYACERETRHFTEILQTTFGYPLKNNWLYYWWWL